MKNALFIQARSNSTRLPKKILKKILGKTILEHFILRIKKSKKIDKILLLTTYNKIDDKIIEIANKCKIETFRGSENNVLERFYKASINLNIDYIIRCNADCPLIDYKIIDRMVTYYNKNRSIDYLSNILEKSFPIGMHVEIFKKNVLYDAQKNCKSTRRREHVTPYIYNSKKFNIKNYKNKVDNSSHRWTLDYYEDLIFIKKIYKLIYNKNKYYGMNDIIKLVNKNPELKKINYHIEKTNNVVY